MVIFHSYVTVYQRVTELDPEASPRLADRVSWSDATFRTKQSLPALRPKSMESLCAFVLQLGCLKIYPNLRVDNYERTQFFGAAPLLEVPTWTMDVKNDPFFPGWTITDAATPACQSNFWFSHGSQSFYGARCSGGVGRCLLQILRMTIVFLAVVLTNHSWRFISAFFVGLPLLVLKTDKMPMVVRSHWLAQKTSQTTPFFSEIPSSEVPSLKAWPATESDLCWSWSARFFRDLLWRAICENTAICEAKKLELFIPPKYKVMLF